MRRPAILLAICALVASACAGPSVLIAGESMRFPEPPPQMVGLVVLGADDLTPIVAQVATTEETLPTDTNGAVELLWEEEPIDLKISAPGFHDAATTVAEKPLEYGPAIAPLISAINQRPLSQRSDRFSVVANTPHMARIQCGAVLEISVPEGYSSQPRQTRKLSQTLPMAIASRINNSSARG